jgi:hypothetical protein
MKKITIIGLLSLCAAGLYAQGTLVFYNNTYSSSSGSGIETHIYSPNPSAPTVEQTGNSSIDFPVPGTAAGITAGMTGSPTVYGGSPIGGASYSGATPPAKIGPVSTYYQYGNLFDSQVFALTATDGSGPATVPFTSLSPISQYFTTMSVNSAEGAGFVIQPNIASDPGIPGTGYKGSGHGAASVYNNAYVAVAAWYNAGGTINSLYGTPTEILAGASYASPAADSAMGLGVPSGESLVFELGGLGEPGSVNTAANVNNKAPSGAPDMSNGGYGGLTSFSLIASPIPEPSTIALCVLGACAFLARRRK